jgi:hypothetical protein
MIGVFLSVVVGRSEEASVRMVQRQATEDVTEVRLHEQPARRVLSHYTFSIGMVHVRCILLQSPFLISFTSEGQAV